MGSTESIPIERCDSTSKSDSNDVYTSDFSLSARIYDETTKQSINNNQSAFASRSCDDTETPQYYRAELNTGKENFDSSVLEMQKSRIICPSKSSERSRTHTSSDVDAICKNYSSVVRKAAKRSVQITDVINFVQSCKVIVDISPLDVEFQHHSVVESQYELKHTKKKLKSEVSRFQPNKHSTRTNIVEGLNQESRLLTAKDDVSRSATESDVDPAASQCIVTQSKEKKRKTFLSKQTDEKLDLHHVLFSTEASVCSSSNSQDMSKDKSHSSSIIKSDVAFDAVGPPRTADQDSDRVQSPHIHDILMGRGNGVAQFPGNQVFRGFCWNAREAYHKAGRNEKGKVAEAVIELVKKRNPPGRFLERQDDFVYTEVPYERVKEKICQALREKKWTPTTIKDDISSSIIAEDDVFVHSKDSSCLSTKQDQELTNFVSKSFTDEVTTPKATDLSQKLKSPVSVDSAPEEIFVKDASLVKDAQKDDKALHPLPLPHTLSPKTDNSQYVSCIDPRHMVKGECARIKVYWPIDKMYYDATILQRVGSFYCVKYDDNEVEWLDLSKNQVKFASMLAVDAPGRGKTFSLRNSMLSTVKSKSSQSNKKGNKNTKNGSVWFKQRALPTKNFISGFC